MLHKRIKYKGGGNANIITGGLMTVGGALITAGTLGGGAAIGVPMMAGGVGSIVKGASQNKNEKELEALALQQQEEQLRQQEQFRALKNFQSGNSDLTMRWDNTPTFAYGGSIVSPNKSESGDPLYMTKYQGPRHEQGGIPIGQNSEVEGNETRVQDYIFSDRLKIPGTDKTFAAQSKIIDQRYSKRKHDPITAVSKKKELQNLMQLQEQLKAAQFEADITRAAENNPEQFQNFIQGMVSGNQSSLEQASQEAFASDQTMNPVMMASGGSLTSPPPLTEEEYRKLMGEFDAWETSARNAKEMSSEEYQNLITKATDPKFYPLYENPRRYYDYTGVSNSQFPLNILSHYATMRTGTAGPTNETTTNLYKDLLKNINVSDARLTVSDGSKYVGRGYDKDPERETYYIEGYGVKPQTPFEKSKIKNASVPIETNSNLILKTPEQKKQYRDVIYDKTGKPYRFDMFTEPYSSAIHIDRLSPITTTEAQAIFKSDESGAEKNIANYAKRDLNKILINANLKSKIEEQGLQNFDDETILNYSDKLYKHAMGGKIKIDPSKRGTFTAWAKKHGMGVAQAAKHVMANKEDYSAAIVKKANFAKNARKWQHKNGGFLETKIIDGQRMFLIEE